MTPEQQIIQVLVEQLMYWAKPGIHSPDSEEWNQACKSQAICTLVTANKQAYPFSD